MSKRFLFFIALLISSLTACNPPKNDTSNFAFDLPGPVRNETDSSILAKYRTEAEIAPEIFEPRNAFEELARSEVEKSLKKGEVLGKFWVSACDTLWDKNPDQKALAICQMLQEILKAKIEQAEIHLERFAEIPAEIMAQNEKFRADADSLNRLLTDYVFRKDSLNRKIGLLRVRTQNSDRSAEIFSVVCNYITRNPAGQRILHGAEIRFSESFEVLRIRTGPSLLPSGN